MIDRSVFVEVWLRDRSRESRDRAIAEYRYLCARAARRFRREQVERDDLEQVAAIGLIKAVDRYRPGMGTPFEAYAWLLILGELMHHVRDSERLVRVPRRILDLERRWAGARHDLVAVLGREPDEREIAERAGFSSEARRAFDSYRVGARVLSTEVLSAEQARGLSYAIDVQLETLAREELFGCLTPLERCIVLEVYERGTPLGALARRLGYSRRQLTRLHRRALDKIEPLAIARRA